MGEKLYTLFFSVEGKVCKIHTYFSYFSKLMHTLVKYEHFEKLHSNKIDNLLMYNFF